MQYGAWIGILVILMCGFAPMISQTLSAKRFAIAFPNRFESIEATLLCTIHPGMRSAEDDGATGGTTDKTDIGAMAAGPMANMPVHTVAAHSVSSTQYQHAQQGQRGQGSHAGHYGHYGHYGHHGNAGHYDQDNQEACGYCSLFAHSPFLVTTLPQLAAIAQFHHTFIATFGAAFRPHTVAAASRPQPPPSR